LCKNYFITKFYEQSTSKKLKDSLKDIKTLFSMLGLLSFLAKQNEELKPFTKEIDALLAHKDTDNDLGKLIQFFLAENDPSTTDTKEMHKLLIKATTNPTFVNALKAVGKIDAMHSIAQLLREEKTKYCIPNYEPRSRAHLKFENMWNPILEEEKQTTENIELITKKEKIASDSDQLKTIAIASIMAQLGIAPATKATIMPFSYLGVLIDSEQEIDAQIAQLSKIVTGLNLLQHNEYGLALINNKKLEGLKTGSDLGRTTCYKGLQQEFANMPSRSNHCAIFAQ